jgi:hypothetical protein
MRAMAIDLVAAANSSMFEVGLAALTTESPTPRFCESS